MLDERQRAVELLNGMPFKKEYYTTAYIIIIKYLKDIGKDMNDIQEIIIQWEKDYGINPHRNLNQFIQNIYGADMLFHKDISIYISNEEINFIKNKFQKKNVRKLALGILCYAKLKGTNSFGISLPSLSQFCNLTYQNIKNRELKELINFKYIEKVPTKQKYKWGWEKDFDINYKIKYYIKILMPITTSGEHLLTNNNFESFYNECMLE